jgi:hypothetical protein
MRPDRWADAGGTLVNLVVGAISLLLSRASGNRAKSPLLLLDFGRAEPSSWRGLLFSHGFLASAAGKK